MPKYLTSLTDIISLMDFLTEVSTLYRVEPGSNFRLVTSNAAAQSSGAGSKNLYGKLLKDFIPNDYYKTIILPSFEKVVETKQPYRAEGVPPFPGTGKVMDTLFSPVVENEECTHIWVITKYRQSKEELEYLAFHDVLTRIPNRRFFLQRLNKAMTRYQQSNIKFALMLLDCDNFKQINDSMGHDVGDQLIKLIAMRLKACIRETDFIARLGGDEFVVIIEDFQTEETIKKIADRTIHTFQDPWHIHDYTLKTTSSIGISIINKEKNIESIISSADTALYEAKSKGRNNYVFFNDHDRLNSL